jgi:amidase
MGRRYREKTDVRALTVDIRDGLPHAVQVIGPRYREDLCLDAAHSLEGQVGIITPTDPR